VSAIAGTFPPLVCPSARTLLSNSNPSTSGMPMSLTKSLIILEANFSAKSVENSCSCRTGLNSKNKVRRGCVASPLISD
jgi:hypothetical protein